VKEVRILIGSHSTCDVQRKAYSEAEIMRSIETGISLVPNEEKVPYEPCNLHDGYNSEMYDVNEGNKPSQAPLTKDSPSHIGSASIDEPTHKSICQKPFHLLLVQRVHHKPWREGDEKGIYDSMALVLQGAGKKDEGSVYRRVGIAGLKETMPGDWFQRVGKKRRITIV
jgi:hypothetical protein